MYYNFLLCAVSTQGCNSYAKMQHVTDNSPQFSYTNTLVVGIFQTLGQDIYGRFTMWKGGNFKPVNQEIFII